MTEGLLFIRVKSTNLDVLDLSTLTSFISDTLIPTIVDSFESDPLVLQLHSVIPGAAFSHLLLIRLEDVEWMKTEAWKSIVDLIEAEVLRKDHELIEIGDSTDYKIRLYEVIQRFEGQMTKPGRGELWVTAANEPATGMDEEFDEWYRKQHLDMLAMVFGFRRSTRYRLLFPQKNSTDDWQIPSEWTEANLPRYLAIHEWDNDQIDKEHAKMPARSEWAKKMVRSYKKYQREDWKFVEEAGDTGSRL